MQTDYLPTELSGETHDYTVEVINRFKGLDLIDRVPEELWTEVGDIIQGWNAKVGSQDIPGVTGKFGLRVQNKAGQRLTEF